MRVKFSNVYESVRKAFLGLDGDRDGFITIEDILKHYGSDRDFQYNDLKKLMIDKSTNKTGKLNYQDFSRWLGGSIHASESFYFRHDSIKNPGYEKAVDKMEREAADVRKASDFYYD
jgi:hypothetical protein